MTLNGLIFHINRLEILLVSISWYLPVYQRIYLIEKINNRNYNMKTNNTYTKEENDKKIKQLEHLILIKKRTKTELTKDINSIKSQIEELKTLDLNQTKIL